LTQPLSNVQDCSINWYLPSPVSLLQVIPFIKDMELTINFQLLTFDTATFSCSRLFYINWYLPSPVSLLQVIPFITDMQLTINFQQLTFDTATFSCSRLFFKLALTLTTFFTTGYYFYNIHASYHKLPAINLRHLVLTRTTFFTKGYSFYNRHATYTKIPVINL
jgi:hypothetical protein